MLFKVTDIKLMGRMVSYANIVDEKELTYLLTKHQIDIYREIEKIKYDSRCIDAYRFCLLFCSIALDQAEMISQMKFMAIPPVSA